MTEQEKTGMPEQEPKEENPEGVESPEELSPKPDDIPAPEMPGGEGAARVSAPEKEPVTKKEDVETPVPPDIEGAARIPPEEREKEEEKPPAYELLETQEKPGSIMEYKISIPWEEYDKRQSRMIKDLKKNVMIEGFRKGKAPERLVKIRFRKEIKQDALNEMFPLIADHILEKNGLKKSQDPVLKESKVEDNQPLELLVSVELFPKLELKRADYTDMEINVKKVKVTDKTVEKTLEDLRKRNAIYEPKEKAPVEENDGVVINLKATDERGMEIKKLEQENQLVENPKDVFPEPVYKELLGKDKGDKFEVDVPHEVKNPRGEVISKKDIWKIELIEIKKCVLPELDDEFAKDLGMFENLEDLKKKILEDNQSHVEKHAREDAFGVLMDKILEKKPFEPPASFVENSKRGMIGEDLRRMQVLGMSMKDLKLDKDKYLDQKEKDASQNVKAILVLQDIIANEKLEVSEQDLEEEIKKIAEMEGRKPLAIRAKLEAENQLESFKDSLLTDKVKNFLLEHNKIAYEELEQE